MMDLTEFHFLRPVWFAVLAPAALLLWSIMKHQDSRAAFRGIIDERLLDHLLTRPEQERGRMRPLFLMAFIILFAIVALAGPAWRREAAPFTEDQAALAIVLKVTPEMLSQDVQPSRLQRAVQKMHDLLALRPGTRNTLIAYAGSAHLVMPLTDDSELIESFAAELEPSLMPRAGDEPVQGIALAQAQLTQAGLPASIVLMADSVDASHLDALRQHRLSGGADVHLLAIAGGPEVIPPANSPPAPPLDLPAMRAAADAAGGKLVVVSVDNSDVAQLNSDIQRSFADAPLEEGSRWLDGGYYVLPILALLMLPFFRHGGAVTLDHNRRPAG